jgi:hypothetical protein
MGVTRRFAQGQIMTLNDISRPPIDALRKAHSPVLFATTRSRRRLTGAMERQFVLFRLDVGELDYLRPLFGMFRWRLYDETIPKP